MASDRSMCTALSFAILLGAVLQANAQRPDCICTTGAFPPVEESPVPLSRVNFGPLGAVGGYTAFDPSALSNGTRFHSGNSPVAAVFREHAWSTSGFSYNLFVGPAKGIGYDVKLWFAEVRPALCAPGKRIFSAKVGSTQFKNIDVAARTAADKCARPHNVKASCVVPDSDGIIKVQMMKGSADNPMLSAIEVFKNRFAPFCTPALGRPLARINFGRLPAPGFSLYDRSALSFGTSVFAGTGAPSRELDEHVWKDSDFLYDLSVGLPPQASTQAGFGQQGPRRFVIKLWFAETYTGHCSIGKRVFSVSIGTQIIRDIDVFSEVGCKKGHSVIFYDVSSSTGFITVNFIKGRSENPMLSAIEVFDYVPIQLPPQANTGASGGALGAPTGKLSKKERKAAKKLAEQQAARQ